MKQYGRFVTVALFATSSLCLPQRCGASESDCDNLPRILSAFGAEGNAGSPLPLASDIRSQLPGLRRVRRVFNTTLAPSGEQVVIYDSNADDSDPHPKIALVVDRRVAKVFDAGDFNPHSGGFERYLSSCEFDLTNDQRALALAVSTGYDGAASVFAVIACQSGEYRILFSPLVGQGRMELGALKLELWSMIWGKVRDTKSKDLGNYECVWCPHHYLVTEYLWRKGKYVKGASYRTKGTHDPTEISGNSLVIRSSVDKRRDRADR